MRTAVAGCPRARASLSAASTSAGRRPCATPHRASVMGCTYCGLQPARDVRWLAYICRNHQQYPHAELGSKSDILVQHLISIRGELPHYRQLSAA